MSQLDVAALRLITKRTLVVSTVVSGIIFALFLTVKCIPTNTNFSETAYAIFYTLRKES